MANKTRAQLKLEWINGNTMTQSTSGGLDVAFDDVWDSHFNLGDDGLQEAYEGGGSLILNGTVGALSISGGQDINLSSTDGGDSLSISIDQATDTITTSVTDGVDTTTVSTTATTFDATNSTGTATIEFDDTTVKGTTNLDLVSDSPVEVKNAVGAAQRIKGDTPVDTDDLATKDYIDTKNLESFRSGVGDGAYTVTVSGGGVTLTVAGAGTGNVTGPGSSTDTAVVRWNGATGTSIQNSGVLIDGTNNVTGVGTLDTTGTITTSTGDIVATAGNIEATAGSLTAGTTIDATGNITTSTGNVIATAGNLEATAGSVTAGTTVDATGNITTSTGDVIATAGNLEATAGNLTIGGDDIIGATQTVNVTEIRTHIDSTTNPHNTTIGNIGTGTRAELETAITDVTTFVVSGDAAGGDLGNTYPDPKVIALTDTAGTRYPLGSLGGPTGNKYLYVNGAGQIIGTTGVGGSDLQQGYDLSPGGGAAEIVTDDGATGRGAVTLRPDGDGTVHGGGLVPDTDNVLEIKDGTNTFTNFAVTGEGKVTGFSFNGVELTTAGVATKFLDEQGNYTIPGASTNLEGNAVYVDAVEGDDGTGTLKNPALPFATISAAITALSVVTPPTDYVIFVRPGDYPEQGLVIPDGTSIIGTGSWQQTFLGPTASGSVGTSPTDKVISLGQDCNMIGFTVRVPQNTGTNVGTTAILLGQAGGTNGLYDINIVGVGATYTAPVTLDNFTPGSCGIERSGGGKTIGAGIRFELGGVEALVKVDSGVLALESTHVPQSAGDIQNVLQVLGTGSSAGRAQMIGFNAGNSNVRECILVEGGDVTYKPVCLIYTANIFNVETAISSDAKYQTINVLGGRIGDLNAAGTPRTTRPFAGYAFASDPAAPFTVEQAESFSIRITANHQPEYIYSPASAQYTDFVLSFSQETTDTSDAAFNIFGGDKLSIGFSERGTGANIGRGAPYTSGMVVLNTDNTTATGPAVGDEGGNITNYTEEAISKSGSNVVFQGNSSGFSILFGSQRRTDTPNEPLKFWGLEMLVDVNEDPIGTGEYIFERWTNANGWQQFDVFCTSKDEGYSYGSNVFWRDDSKELIRFGLDDDNEWDSRNIQDALGNTYNCYWVRVRINTGMTIAPEFESVKIIESSFNVSKEGVPSSTGLAQFRKNLALNGPIWTGDSGGSSLGLYTDTVGAGGTAWTHRINDSLFASANDAAMIQFPIPIGTCTAFPIVISMKYLVTGGGATFGVNDITASVYPIKSSGVLVADIAGFREPTERPAVLTGSWTAPYIAETLTANPATVTVTTLAPPGTTPGITSQADLDGKLHIENLVSVDVSDYYEGDLILIRLENTAHVQDIALFSLIAEGVSHQGGKGV
jgi:hypothetical protein